MNGEDTRIQRLRAILESTTGPTYIGDDAAVLPWSRENMIVSVDAQVDGTHFRRAWCTSEDIGFRSLMAAASDLAAMGASPSGAVAALTLPPELSAEDLDAMARGQRLAADEIGCPIVGGNLARAPMLSVTTTVFGYAARPLTRMGASPGDGIFIAGALGLSRAGLLSFERDVDVPHARAAFRRPRAHLREGLLASSLGASAAMDISDGLAEDAPRLALASNVTLCFESALLLATGGPALAEASAALGEDALPLALEGGEDYALLVTGAFACAPEGFVRVGAVRSAPSEEAGPRVLVDGAPLMLRGFSHFVR